MNTLSTTLLITCLLLFSLQIKTQLNLHESRTEEKELQEALQDARQDLNNNSEELRSQDWEYSMEVAHSARLGAEIERLKKELQSARP